MAARSPCEGTWVVAPGWPAASSVLSTPRQPCQTNGFRSGGGQLRGQALCPVCLCPAVSPITDGAAFSPSSSLPAREPQPGCGRGVNRGTWQFRAEVSGAGGASAFPLHPGRPPSSMWALGWELRGRPEPTSA